MLFVVATNSFHIDVTFEMRTAVQSKVFIQLISQHTIRLYFISETEKGTKGKIAERQRESEGERVSIGRRRM
jgi:hypothetical protein